MIEIESISPEDYHAFSSLTFEGYRKYMVEAEEETILVVGARMDTNPIGMALYQYHITDGEGKNWAQLKSVFVNPLFRNLGIATKLLAHSEKALVEIGIASIEGQYQQEYGHIEVIEKLLRKSEWEYKPYRLLAYSRFASGITEDPLLRRMAQLPQGYEIFRWETLPEEDRADIANRFTDEKLKKVYTSNFNPFSEVCRNYLKHSSLGLRHGGRVVAWVLVTNHHIPDTAHYINMFAEPIYADRGLGMALVYKSLKLEKAYLGEGFERHARVWQVFYQNPKMIQMTEKRLSKYCYEILHYHIATKRIEIEKTVSEVEHVE